MKNIIKFCCINLLVFGVVLLIIPLTNTFGIVTGIPENYGLSLSSSRLYFTLLIFLLAILNLSSALLIYRMKLIGRTLGIILSIFGILPLQSVFLWTSLWILFTFIGIEILNINWFTYFIPVILLMIYHITIFNLLLKNNLTYTKYFIS